MSVEHELMLFVVLLLCIVIIAIGIILLIQWQSMANEFEYYEKTMGEAETEIIRCKDCKYNTTSKKCLHPDSIILIPADDDFCSYAERREE